MDQRVYRYTYCVQGVQDIFTRNFLASSTREDKETILRMRLTIYLYDGIYLRDIIKVIVKKRR